MKLRKNDKRLMSNNIKSLIGKIKSISVTYTYHTTSLFFSSSKLVASIPLFDRHKVKFSTYQILYSHLRSLYKLYSHLYIKKMNFLLLFHCIFYKILVGPSVIR